MPDIAQGYDNDEIVTILGCGLSTVLSDKRAHLSSIGLVSISPIRHDRKFFTTTLPGGAKSAEMSYVLDELHEHFRGTIILIWDNLKGHIGLQAKYEREHPDWLHFERLTT